MYNRFLQSCNGLFGFERFQSGGILVMIIGIVLIVIIVFLLFKKGSFAFEGKNHDSPLEHLKKRFVNGEINKEEYLEKKNILEND